MTPSPAAPPRPAPRRPWLRLFWIWAVFWLILFALGAQEYLWSGGRRFWHPLADYGIAAVLSTVLAAVQIRRASRFDPLLGQPVRWFLHVWAWMPLQMVAFIAAMYLLRFTLYTLAGERYSPGWHGEVLAYEGFKFVLYYALLGGIQFGQRSYRAWANERVRTEQQARLAQQARLDQLTQQLQPHFLFNALNTVSSLIHSEPQLADTLLTRLATLLRAATDASQRPLQPLAEELALLRAYADIMGQRFADRVAIRWEIEPAALSCEVPTLSLQPLLENCFRHVVERRLAATSIVVRVARAGARLRIEVEDDGESAAATPVAGVGLGNLQRRLASLYGEQGRLELTPRAGGGLVARVELPCAP